jgi:hypothetical protein
MLFRQMQPKMSGRLHWPDGSTPGLYPAFGTYWGCRHRSCAVFFSEPQSSRERELLWAAISRKLALKEPEFISGGRKPGRKNKEITESGLGDA